MKISAASPRGNFQAQPAHVQTSLENILDLEQLKQIFERILDAESWEELLARQFGEALRLEKKEVA